MTSLLTKEQKLILPQLYATEHIKMEDKLIIAKLFHPIYDWYWYVIEWDGLDECFGLVKGIETEFGYFSLLELQNLETPSKLPVIQDQWFQPCQVKEVL
jgi:hypothetical protein